MRVVLFLSLFAAGACGGVVANVAQVPPTGDREHVAELATLEKQVLERVAASDPRLALRLGVVPDKATLSRIETEGVLAEDGKTALRGTSVDLFSFGARARTLAAAEKQLAAWKTVLPDVAPPGSVLARPRLERELLARLIEEERERVEEERLLDDASGSLVRGIVTTWSSGGSAWDWRDRDEWIARRLLEIGASLKGGKPHAAPSDLEPALFDLEKLLVPMQFPRGVAALTSLHGAIDADERPDPSATPSDMLAQRLRVHLGVTTALPEIVSALEAARGRIAADLAAATSGVAADAREAVDQKARAWLLEEARCPEVAGSPVRSAAPPPERAAICGVLRLVERASARGADRAPALAALHDTLVVASWSIVPAQPRTRIATVSFRGDEDLADRMKHVARARPLLALAAGLAIDLLYASPSDAPRLAKAWLAIGDVPLDVARRELATASPPRASPRP